MIIRRAQDDDWKQMWPIFRAVVSTGTTYVFAADTTEDDARSYWFATGVTSWVAEDDDRVLGFYRLIESRRDLGSHVANASFMVDPQAQGRRVGESLGRHCLR